MVHAQEQSCRELGKDPRLKARAGRNELGRAQLTPPLAVAQLEPECQAAEKVGHWVFGECTVDAGCREASEPFHIRL